MQRRSSVATNFGVNLDYLVNLTSNYAKGVVPWCDATNYFLNLSCAEEGKYLVRKAIVNTTQVLPMIVLAYFHQCPTSPFSWKLAKGTLNLSSSILIIFEVFGGLF
ncbi:hypothetical protein CsSME_00031550 [Camellia sinensis var. sinensis]